jgi:hypothetical protein
MVTKFLPWLLIPAKDRKEMSEWDGTKFGSFDPAECDMSAAIVKDPSGTILACCAVETIEHSYLFRGYFLKPGLSDAEAIAVGDTITRTLASVAQQSGVKQMLMPLPVGDPSKPDTIFQGMPCAVHSIAAGGFMPSPKPRYIN